MLGRVGAYWDDVVDPPVVKFAGWARMALPLTSFRITEVRRRPGSGLVSTCSTVASCSVAAARCRLQDRFCFGACMSWAMAAWLAIYGCVQQLE